jgi:hypothetical protein
MRSKKVFVRVALLSALSLIAATSAGCLLAAAAGAAAGTVAYVKGDLTAHVDADVEQTTKAARAVLVDMGGTVPEFTFGPAEGKVYGRTPEDKKVNIDTKYVTEKTTKLTIRVETFGNEAVSRQILDAIKAKLKAGPVTLNLD